MSNGKTSNKRNVEVFVETAFMLGLRNVVISPGSRNAPLTIAFDEHPEIKTFLIHDERSAGFVAMGMALEKKEPVAVLCTSGSAVLNYFPAVAEAYYQSIPLVVISADRPIEWVNHGDGQTIMQEAKVCWERWVLPLSIARSTPCCFYCMCLYCNASGCFILTVPVRSQEWDRVHQLRQQNVRQTPPLYICVLNIHFF